VHARNQRRPTRPRKQRHATYAARISSSSDAPAAIWSAQRGPGVNAVCVRVRFGLLLPAASEPVNDAASALGAGGAAAGEVATMAGLPRPPFFFSSSAPARRIGAVENGGDGVPMVAHASHNRQNP
jgi:hypothetical protein